MFRFTIRDLLWLMVVVGMSVGWWVDSSGKKTTLKKMARQRSTIETVIGHAWRFEIHEFPDGSIQFRRYEEVSE